MKNILRVTIVWLMFVATGLTSTQKGHTATGFGGPVPICIPGIGCIPANK